MTTGASTKLPPLSRAVAAHNLRIRDRPLVTVSPSSGESGLVVIFHGAGDTAQGGWCELAEEWGTAMRHVKFLLPTAPVRGAMTAWMAKNKKTGKLCKYESLWTEVLELIEAERVLHKVPLSRVVLVGLSAGALMASWVAMNLPSRCAGLVLLSGLTPCERLPEPRMAAGVEQTPVLYCVGAEDTQIPPKVVRASAERLRRRGFVVDFHEIPELAHDVSDEEAMQVLGFLKEVLPEEPADSEEALQIGLAEDIQCLKISNALDRMIARPPPQGRVHNCSTLRRNEECQKGLRCVRRSPSSSRVPAKMKH